MKNVQNNPYVKSPAYTWFEDGTQLVVKGMNPFRHNVPKHFRFNNKQDANNFMIKQNKKVIADFNKRGV
jgi:hypothetical protein